MYYLGFYDRILNLTQVNHNYACFMPPSLPSLRPSYVYGDMNTRFPITIPIYDYNLHSSTNLIPNYFISITLLSLPTVGVLYTDALSPLNSLPAEGLLLTNVSLYYQPPQGFYHNSIPYVYLLIRSLILDVQILPSNFPIHMVVAIESSWIFLSIG